MIINISGNCNPFGCDCIYEHCGGWLPWCDPNEMCADKKRNMMEVLLLNEVIKMSSYY